MHCDKRRARFFVCRFLSAKAQAHGQAMQRTSSCISYSLKKTPQRDPFKNTGKPRRTTNAAQEKGEKSRSVFSFFRSAATV